VGHDPIWDAGAAPDPDAAPADGHVGRYRALVADNVDRMEEHRLNVKIPEVLGDDTTAWAKAAPDLAAADSAGTLFDRKPAGTMADGRHCESNPVRDPETLRSDRCVHPKSRARTSGAVPGRFGYGRAIDQAGPISGSPAARPASRSAGPSTCSWYEWNSSSVLHASTITNPRSAG
jgi:hypothetical protein